MTQFEAIMKTRGQRALALCALGCLLAVLFLLEMITFDRLRYGYLPYRLDYVPPGYPTPLIISLALTAIALLQTCVLLLIYRIKGASSRGATVVLSLAAVVCMIVAIRAPFTNSNDVYAYIGYAKLPTMASVYDPPNRPFTGQFSVVNAIWKTPLRTCVYGPLWVGLNRLLLADVASVAQCIQRLRLGGALMMLVLSLLVLGLWPRTRLVWLVALNPALIFEYVVNAHNDLFGILMVVCALALMKRGLIVPALLLGALAALIKVTFLVVAIATLASFGRLRNRLSAVITIVVCAAIPSWFFGRMPYLHALTTASGDLPSKSLPLTGIQMAIHVALIALMALAVLLVVYRKVFLRTAGWTFGALSTNIFSWYLGWGLPYSLHGEEVAAVFLLGLPLLDILLAAAFPHLSHPVAWILILLLVCIELVRTKNLFGDRRRLTTT